MQYPLIFQIRSDTNFLTQIKIDCIVEEVNAFPTWRCVSHKLASELDTLFKNGASRSEIQEKLGNGAIRTGMLEGDLDNGINTISNAIELIKNIKSCDEIIQELIDAVSF